MVGWHDHPRVPATLVPELGWSASDHDGEGHAWDRHVQEDPDRQSRRDRLPGHADGEGHGHQDRRGLFRAGRRRAACARGGRGGGDRPGGGGAELSVDREDRRGLQADRRRGGPSRLRLPVGEPQVRGGAEGGRHRLHRPRSARHRGDGRQDRIQEAGQGSRRQFRPGLSRRHQGRRRGGEDRQGDRLSGDDQGLGRRRRQGHAHRARRPGGARRLPLRHQRGALQLRRRPGVHREVHRGPAPHRDPGAGATATATASISASANARSSAATRR